MNIIKVTSTNDETIFISVNAITIFYEEGDHTEIEVLNEGYVKVKESAEDVFQMCMVGIRNVCTNCRHCSVTCTEPAQHGEPVEFTRPFGSCTKFSR